MAQMPHWMPNGAAAIGTTHTSVVTRGLRPPNAAPAPVTNKHAVSTTHRACPTASFAPSKNITYTDIRAKKYQPNSANSQLPSSSTTAAIAISADTTNARENHRVGQGKTHHASPHTIWRAANVAMAAPDAGLPAAGHSSTSETIPSMPVPTPIATWIVLDMVRLVKYCTWVA